MLLQLFGGHSICYFKIFISSEIVRVDYVLFVCLFGGIFLLFLFVLAVSCQGFFACLFVLQITFEHYPVELFQSLGLGVTITQYNPE